MAVYDTPENNRHEQTGQTLECMHEAGIFKRHDVYVIDNGSTCERTKHMFRTFCPFKVIETGKNLGTAGAINQAWKHRASDQPAVKMDNDVLTTNPHWPEKMIEALERDSRIGIVGLKRKDCWEHPTHENADLRSELYMLPHEPGQRWIVGEKVFHVMGTCQMYSPALLEKIGYLYQPGLYGYDDVLAAHRCHAAGMWSVFLPHIEIDHIDPGNTPYQSWKERTAGEKTQEVIEIAKQYRTGIRSIYYNPFQ